MPDLDDTIEDLAAKPAAVSSDGLSVTERPLADIVEADRYLKGGTAGGKNHQGLRITLLKPPGSV